MGNIKDEETNFQYLQDMHLEKTLPKLIKKLRGKKVVIYGAGSFFQCIKKHYDLSGLNIVGIADRSRFVSGADNYEMLIRKYYDIAGIDISGITDLDFDFDFESNEYKNIKVQNLDDIMTSEVDYILVGLKRYVSVLEDLYEKFKKTKVKVKPLVRKSIFDLLKEF